MDGWIRIGAALGRLSPRLVSMLERGMRALPPVRARMEHEYDAILAGVAAAMRPPRAGLPAFRELPEQGKSREEILREVEALLSREQARWERGLVSGAVYHGDPDHIDFLNRVYALSSQSNPLHSDVWPSNARFEAEIIAMTASLLSAGAARAAGDVVCGAVTSGGTESIVLAVKAYRDRARDLRGIRRPEVVLPETAHPAFDKACQLLGIRAVHVPAPNFRADPAKVEAAITRRTILIAGSAPSFPHGAVDPIAELSEIARRHGIGFHTDACLGGFLLPFAERLGYPVPPFDFRLPGVTSMSADTHKYGYAPKGSSVVLYRGVELRRYQYFTATEWPGGIYFSPTLAGSRPGALSAACWAAMVAMGDQGYLEAARRILEAAAAIRAGVAAIPEIRLLGDGLFVIAFTSDRLDIYRVMDRMAARGWSLNGLHKPAGVHLCVTLRHAEAGVAERFLRDLRASVVEVQAEPDRKGGMAPVYGLAGTLPLRGAVRDLLVRFLDRLYEL